jgi:probable DNA metabolism protein
MRTVYLQSPIDFTGWREHSRALLIQHVRPDEVRWIVDGEAGDLFGTDAKETGAQLFTGAARVPTVPSSFLALAKKAALHSDPARYSLLYRLLWRLQRERGLMDAAIDTDVAKLRDLSKSIRRDRHKMTAFVRFREVQTPGGPHFVAWFEPEHYIVEATADFFVKRFGSMRWSILTPQACAHWDLKTLTFTPGASKKDAPTEDALEEFWRSYYANIFNPARLKLDAMRAEMPQKYWRNLPEAPLIKPLAAEAAKRAAAMVGAEAARPRPNMQRLEVVAKAKSPSGVLQAVREAAEQCRACPLWRDATQTVFGEGPMNAEIMFVGEQPGDQEDIAGKPFVGPAGQLFDRALLEAEIERNNTYVTNAVKHFKFVPRGKRRIHQKPNTSEIKACRQWFERERDLLKPKLIVALGATAAYQVFGRTMPIQKNRGEIMELTGGTHALITVHPSFLLRVLPEDREREYKEFIRDLRLVREYFGKQIKAA